MLSPPTEGGPPGSGAAEERGKRTPAAKDKGKTHYLRPYTSRSISLCISFSTLMLCCSAEEIDPRRRITSGTYFNLGRYFAMISFSVTALLLSDKGGP